MGNTKVNYDLFARITTDEATDPNEIVRIVRKACKDAGLEISCTIEKEPSAEIPVMSSLIEEDE